MNRRLKAWLSYQRCRVFRATGLLWLAKKRMAKKGIVVLTFHRVLPDDEFANSSSLPGIIVRQKTFERFIAWASQACDIVDLGNGFPSWDTSAPRPRIALTFDDGWLDNYEVLRNAATRHSATATIFICPGLMARRFPFWPERVNFLLRRLPGKRRVHDIFDDSQKLDGAGSASEVIERLKALSPSVRDKCIERLEKLTVNTADTCSTEALNCTMTWEQLEDLKQDGITLASHTVTHPILTQIPLDDAHRELLESRLEIEKKLGNPCRMFAYPNGNNNEELRERARAAGYSVAFTTEPGCWTRASHLLGVPRINISDEKLIDPRGRFSPAMAEYAMFWH